jgi:hypothetical protein
MNCFEALSQRQVDIKKLEIMATEKGIDLQAVREQAKTTVHDYKSLLLNAMEQNKMIVASESKQIKFGS